MLGFKKKKNSDKLNKNIAIILDNYFNINLSMILLILNL